MEPILAELASSLDGIVARASLRFRCTRRSPAAAPKDLRSAQTYWPQNVRQPVAFADAVQALLDDGFTTFCRNRSPSGVVERAARLRQGRARKEIRLVETLRRNEVEARARLHRTVAQVVSQAVCEIDWTLLNGEGYVTRAAELSVATRTCVARNRSRRFISVSGPTDRPMLGCEQYPAHGRVGQRSRTLRPRVSEGSHRVRHVDHAGQPGMWRHCSKSPALLHPDAPRLASERRGDSRGLSSFPATRAIDYVSSYERITKPRDDPQRRKWQDRRRATASDRWRRRVCSRRKSVMSIWKRLIKAALSSEQDPAVFYREGLSRIGLQYGGEVSSRYGRCVLAPRGGAAWLALIERDAALRSDGYHAQPVMLDACFPGPRQHARRQ